MAKPYGVILAGGRAQRMGGCDKALQLLSGTPLLSHVVQRLSPQVSSLVINANGDAGRFDDFALPVVEDTIQGFAGPLAGVLAGLDWAAGQGGDCIVTVATDTPFFPIDLVAQFEQATLGQENPLVVAASHDGGLHPTFGLWPVSLRDALRQDLECGMRKMMRWVRDQGGRTLSFDATPPNIDAFFNINTAADLSQAEALLLRASV